MQTHLVRIIGCRSIEGTPLEGALAGIRAPHVQIRMRSCFWDLCIPTSHEKALEIHEASVPGIVVLSEPLDAGDLDATQVTEAIRC